MNKKCGCGEVLVGEFDVRCSKCDEHTGLGTKHVCFGCPGMDSCPWAWEDDPMDGLCPADYVEHE
jgi:hypothetical protein